MLGQLHMKKLFVLALLGLVALGGCKKEKLADEPKDSPVYWFFQFSLIDGSGEYIFPDPPPNFTTSPFDPRESFLVSGDGSTHKLRLHGDTTYGLHFSFDMFYKELLLDSNFARHNKLIYKIYFEPGGKPNILEVHNPNIAYHGHGGDLMMWNNDTLLPSTKGLVPGLGLYEILYP